MGSHGNEPDVVDKRAVTITNSSESNMIVLAWTPSRLVQSMLADWMFFPLDKKLSWHSVQVNISLGAGTRFRSEFHIIWRQVTRFYIRLAKVWRFYLCCWRLESSAFTLRTDILFREEKKNREFWKQAEKVDCSIIWWFCLSRHLISDTKLTIPVLGFLFHHRKVNTPYFAYN